MKTTAKAIGLSLVLALAACGGGAGGGGGGGGGAEAQLASAAGEAQAEKARIKARDNLHAQAPQVANLPGADATVAALGALDNGGHRVAWTTADGGIHLRRYGADGEPAGEPVTLAFTRPEGWMSAPPAVAALRGGEVVVAYARTRELPRDPAPPLGESAVYIERFDALGRQVQAQTQVDAWVGSPGYRPVSLGLVTLAPLADGGFALGWATVSTSGIYGAIYSLRAQAFGPDGTATGLPTPLGQAWAEAALDLAPAPGGGYVATVHSLDASYQPVARAVHVGAQGSESPSPVVRSREIVLMPLPGGEAVLFSRDDEGAFAQRLRRTGHTGKREPLAALPVVAQVLPDGSYGVVWPEGGALRGQRHDDKGRPLGEAFDAPQPGTARLLSAASDPPGLLLAWSAPGPEGRLNTYTQRWLVPVRR